MFKDMILFHVFYEYTKVCIIILIFWNSGWVTFVSDQYCQINFRIRTNRVVYPAIIRKQNNNETSLVRIVSRKQDGLKPRNRLARKKTIEVLNIYREKKKKMMKTYTVRRWFLFFNIVWTNRMFRTIIMSCFRYRRKPN